jgi:hypothetical protein
MHRHLPLILLCALVLTGCCIHITTAVRNETGKNVTLIIHRYSGQAETLAIRAGAKARCGGVMPRSLDGAADSWTVSDGQSRFVFVDVSPIATMPDAFVSSSRLTGDFPCKRVTQHVRLAPDMTIQAVRVIGYTATQPAPFPIQYTKKEAER